MESDLLKRLEAATGRTQKRSERAQALADLVRDATGARWVGIYTLRGETVVNDAWSGPGPPAHPSFPSTTGLTAHAVRTRAVAVSNDVTRDPRYLANQDDSGSELIVPVLRGDRVVGTLDVESGQLGAFTGEAIVGYERIAHVLGVLWEDGTPTSRS